MLKIQLDFMDSVFGYPDGTERYIEFDLLVGSLEKVDQYLKHFDDGSIAIL